MNEIYSLRKNFSIIGLTGLMGSGCSKLANLLSQEKEAFFSSDQVRVPSSLKINKEQQQQSNIFRRKYSICYKYVNTNWVNYKVIDYKNVLLLYTIDYLKYEDNSLDSFIDVVMDLYKKSTDGDDDFPDDISLSKPDLEKLCIDNNFNSIVDRLKKIDTSILDVKDEGDLQILRNIFFESENDFSKLCHGILKLLEETNYYLRTLLLHRLANNIRMTGNPNSRDITSQEHIYTLARLINRLIKSYKAENSNNCHIVINSLKNSLEIMFFKERYSAFYSFAVHNKEGETIGEISRIKESLQDSPIRDLTEKKLLFLDQTEYKSDEFASGTFSSPDIQNCIQKSEIHINDPLKDAEVLDFYTMEEQIIKYQALIQQPGIITPSSIERCMQIAYNSKFSSGCISRQVGAVVTGEDYSIKAIGWNDVPKDATPCLLKNLKEIVEPEAVDSNDKTYSKFEIALSSDGNEFIYVKKEANQDYAGSTFKENVEKYYESKIGSIIETGKNCSFCFKSLHNKFEGEKNQVHTRSLHAEENAMLQISKYGGQGLQNGILFTTASPCELCSKKAYQLGIKKIIYIDRYPGISMTHVLNNGYRQPQTVVFKGVVGKSFNKMYEPFLSYKDELSVYMNR